MYAKFSVLFFSLMLLITCKSQNTKSETTEVSEAAKTVQTTDKVDKEGMIYLKEGETLQLSDLKMNIKFNGIKEDSRCPEGVQCVWQGAAVAEVEFLSVHARPRTLELATVNMEGRGYTKSGIYDGYLFTLISVTPSKEKRTEKNPYTIALKVEKNQSNSGESEKNTSSSQRGGSATTR